MIVSKEITMISEKIWESKIVDLDKGLLPVGVGNIRNGSDLSELQFDCVSSFVEVDWQSGGKRFEDASSRDGSESWVFDSIDEQTSYEVVGGTWVGYDVVAN